MMISAIIFIFIFCEALHPLMKVPWTYYVLRPGGVSRLKLRKLRATHTLTAWVGSGTRMDFGCPPLSSRDYSDERATFPWIYPIPYQCLACSHRRRPPVTDHSRRQFRFRRGEPTVGFQERCEHPPRAGTSPVFPRALWFLSPI
jgi:hypothetical protein